MVRIMLDTRDRDASEQLMPDPKAICDEEPSAVLRTDFSPIRERPPQERSPGGDWSRERRDEDPQRNHEQNGHRGTGLLRRHPIASAIELVLLMVVLSIGYLYWNYTNDFESTDDAYIATRQFAIAPEVSGYITAVPVTDDQHVAAGGVVARIDDRLIARRSTTPRRKSPPRRPISKTSMRS
jgi:membrane fusion protein (multidrug efflux system)